MKKMLYYNNLPIKVEIDKHNTAIIDSYRIKSKKDMKNILMLIKDEANYDDAINRLSMKSMIREWRAHNLLYNLGILRSHTGTVDLNDDNKWYLKLGYFILSCLYF